MGAIANNVQLDSVDFLKLLQLFSHL